jgi:hypothetical protein
MNSSSFNVRISIVSEVQAFLSLNICKAKYFIGVTKILSILLEQAIYDFFDLFFLISFIESFDAIFVNFYL